jgi:asparagine synthase (glutamine-hydrolysing)
MCGIAGIVSLKGRELARDILDRMVRSLSHRGPDCNGAYHGGTIGLAHARLSIIDLSGGHQPMSNEDGSLWITFNGEVFNYVELRNELIRKGHRFLTHSDTEVILHMYEEKAEECVQHFNGQWAFAIWDAKRHRLFLSRDRIGVLPLFYTLTPDSFLFASEIKAILNHPEVKRSIDLRALDQVFTFWHSLPPQTMFKGISELPPGHSMVVVDGQVRTWPYWSVDYSSVDYDMKEDDCAARLMELLSDAVRIRLRSDVPVGSYLSGGLDSSVITALVNQYSVGEPLKRALASL